MNTISGKVQMYNVYDETGALVDKGTSKYLSEKYCTEPETISNAARNGTKLQWKYRIEKGAMEERPEITERKAAIKKLYNQGLKTTQISKQTRLAMSTVEKHIRQMREEGEII